jgi:hypothetical protein
MDVIYQNPGKRKDAKSNKRQMTNHDVFGLVCEFMRPCTAISNVAPVRPTINEEGMWYARAAKVE